MRWLFRIAVTLLSLVVLVVAALFLIPSERIARIAETQFEQKTGRRLSIEGEVSPQIFPRLGVTLGQVSVSNASWSSTGPMLSAERLEVGVGFSALMGGDIVVEAFDIVAPVIRLERNGKGQANWDFLAELGADEDDGTDSTQSFSLPLAKITDGKIEFRDDQAQQSHALSDVDAQLKLPDMAATGALELSAKLRGQPFTAVATLNGVQQLLDGGVQNVDLDFKAGGSHVTFKGNVGMEPVQAKGALFAALHDHDALFALLGSEKPRIPEGLGQKVDASGELTVTAENKVLFRGANIALDQNRLTGDIDITLADKPFVVAKLAGDDLDFSAMSTDTTEDDGAANAGAGGWSDARLDVSGLGAVDGNFALKAKAIDLGSIQLAQTDISGTIDNSRMVLDLKDVGVFDGKVSGNFVVNNRKGLSVGGDMSASEVAMQRLLSDFAGFERLIGKASMTLKFVGSGSTMDQIMKSLSGSGAMQVGRGELRGLDIAGMIKNLDASFEGEGSKTVFDEITATYVIEKGVLKNSDLNFVAELLTATGEGEIDLGGQSIDYRLSPLALASKLEKGVRVPVIIQGPWSNIKFRPDLKALIDTELEEEKVRLKEEAKAKEEALKAEAKAREKELKSKAASKLENELDVTREEDQTVEDAVKQGLEDKAKKKLRGLFGDK